MISSSNRRLLVIAPHPDDEVLGAGGIIAKYAAADWHVTVLTVSGHRPPLYPEEMYQRTVKEARAAHAIMGVHTSTFLDIPATMLNDEPVHVFNGRILDVVSNVKPGVVLCPFPDRHVDHRIVFESAMVATRPVGLGAEIEVVAAYETLSETHWNAPHIEPCFTPNWVVDISDFIDIKRRALASYESQVSPFPGPRSVEAAEALAMFRGTQSGFAYGEGLHLVRMRS